MHFLKHKSQQSQKIMTNSPTNPLFPPILFSTIILIASVILTIKAQQPYSGHHHHHIPRPAKHLIFADVRLTAVYTVIQRFKSTITSDPLNVTKSWTGSDVCGYIGFYCEAPPDNTSATALASIDFNGFRLSAPTLENFLENLPDLALFHANSNYFCGTISPKTANLRYLYELDVSNNRLSGSFPTAVLAMEGLTFLDIRFNLFSGSVPPQILTSQTLDFLFVNNNAFSHINLIDDHQTLKPSHIVYITLANNEFAGAIPPVIIELFSSVAEVLLSGNKLAGCVPYELGFLKAARVVDLSDNQLTGPLPYSTACLDSVEQLNLAGNLLYGMVPDVVCVVLEKLERFSLSDNYFMHVGPLCRRLIERGILEADRNCIPDLPNQRSLKECLQFLSSPKKLICPFNMWSYNHFPCEPPRFSSHASLLSSP